MYAAHKCSLIYRLVDDVWDRGRGDAAFAKSIVESAANRLQNRYHPIVDKAGGGWVCSMIWVLHDAQFVVCG
jgi:hypothetical protein